MKPEGLAACREAYYAYWRGRGHAERAIDPGWEHYNELHIAVFSAALTHKQPEIDALKAKDAERVAHIYNMAAENAILRAKVEELQRDADRYRWLRDDAYHAAAGPNGKMTWCVTGEGCSTAEPIDGKELDDAIDNKENGQTNARNAVKKRVFCASKGGA